MRYLIGELSLALIGAILHLRGRRWIGTATSRRLTTAVTRATIWLLTPPPEPR